MLQKQKERREKEEEERIKSMPNGLKALWSRLTGKYQKIRAQNEQKTECCKTRDRDEKQALIERQLTQRQNLQDQVKPILRKHRNTIIQLKKDIAKYMEMGKLDKKTLQENLNQMAKVETKRYGRGQYHGYTQECSIQHKP